MKEVYQYRVFSRPQLGKVPSETEMLPSATELDSPPPGQKPQPPLLVSPPTDKVRHLAGMQFLLPFRMVSDDLYNEEMFVKHICYSCVFYCYPCLVSNDTFTHTWKPMRKSK